MDATKFKELVKRLREANKIITKLDPAIRERAFALLEDYVAARDPDKATKRRRGPKSRIQQGLSRAE